MLIILVVCLVLASIFIVCLKKDKEPMLLLCLCLSLMFEIAGVMIYMAKKGGISYEVMQFFYFTNAIQIRIRYFLISLSQMGFLIALGRTVFPYFLLHLALQYSMIPIIRTNQWIYKAIIILPILTLILYLPKVYHYLVNQNAEVQLWLAESSMIWIMIYLLLSVVLLLVEYFSITMKFCRQEFRQIMISLFALMGIYLLYCRQDPGQVYRFYSSPFAWNKGIGYLQGTPSVFSYATLVLISTVCCVMGFYSLFRFTTNNYEENRNDAMIRRKFDTARIGASMFVHSMKNQLLSNKVVYKRIAQIYNAESMDTQKLKQYIEVLEEVNTNMLTRVEELYRCVKANSIVLVPHSVEDIFARAIEIFHEKYPDIMVDIKIMEPTMILADKIHLCEALYNLLTNAQEAVQDKKVQKEPAIVLYCHNERLYTVLEVRDYGIGMSKLQQAKVFEPFYSNKNSNFNWGMGLYYVREIIKGHLGLLKIESKEGEGSSFFILLPKYQ